MATPIDDVENGSLDFDYESEEEASLNDLSDTGFDLLGPIGEGQFGQVFKCNHPFYGKFALKKVSQERAEEFRSKTQDELNKLKDEVLVIQQLNHKNVIQVYGLYWTDDEYGIGLELCKYGDLYRFMDVHSGRITDAIKVYFMSQICKGMGYLHSKDIVHDNLRMENILVIEGLVLKITDFGLQSWFGENARNLQTTGHLPPERLPNDDKSTPEPAKCHDIYTFGILTWELIAEESAYEGLPAELIRVCKKDGKTPNTDTDKFQSFDPPQVLQILQRCWDKDPDKRPTFPDLKITIDDMSIDLAQRIDVEVLEFFSKLLQGNFSDESSNAELDSSSIYGDSDTEAEDWIQDDKPQSENREVPSTPGNIPISVSSPPTSSTLPIAAKPTSHPTEKDVRPKYQIPEDLSYTTKSQISKPRFPERQPERRIRERRHRRGVREAEGLLMATTNDFKPSGNEMPIYKGENYYILQKITQDEVEKSHEPPK